MINFYKQIEFFYTVFKLYIVFLYYFQIIFNLILF